MVRAILTGIVLAVVPGTAESPTFSTPYGSAQSWFCGLVRDWQAVMRRDHPKADRSLPEIERNCGLSSEPDHAR